MHIETTPQCELKHWKWEKSWDLTQKHALGSRLKS